MSRFGRLIFCALGGVYAALPARIGHTFPASAPSSAVEMPEQTVHGRTRPRIVIVRMGNRFGEEAWPEVERRTGAELSALGFDVVRVDARAAETDARLVELSAQAGRQDAIAAVRIARRGDHRAVQVWIYDAVTRKLLRREAELSPSDATGAYAALQVVELLHASLIEVRIARKSMLGRKAPPLVKRIVARKLAEAEPPRPVAAGPGRWQLDGAGALLWLGDGLHPVGGLAIALSYGLGMRFRIGTELLLPLFASSLSDDRGEAHVLGGTLRLVALFEPWADARVSPGFGVALGGLLLRAKGEGGATSTGHTEWSAVPAAAARLQLGVRLTRALRLVASTAVGAVVPAVQVRFDDDTLATAGQPMVDSQVGIKWSWGHR